MKKYILIIVLLLFAGSGLMAQTFSNDNFIYTARPKKAVQSANFNTLTKDEMSQNVNYFDGLGRSVQTIAIGQGGNGADIITPIEYDALGRQTKEYLPYALINASNNYSKIAPTVAITAVLGFYNVSKYENTTNPFSEKKLEASPLNTVLKQAAPGASWKMGNGHEIKLDYKTNTTADAVRLYKATTSWQASQGLYEIAFSDQGNYLEKQLYKNVTFDENSAANPSESAGSTVEFKNKQGQVILKRTYDAEVKHDTYYVYDTYGNLTYVIPPKADGTINSTVLNGLCYQYKYDYRNRLVEKKLPGKQWEFIVYDKQDRPVATGPAFSPFKDDTSVGWLITKYDIFGRPIYTGWNNQSSNTTTRKSLQDAQNVATVLFETKQASGTIDGIAVNYSNVIAPTSFKLLTVNYYDDYVYPNIATIPTTVENQSVLVNTKGLATGSWVRAVTLASAILGETTSIFYDDRARPVRTYVKNHLGGYITTDSKLDFTGKAIYTITKHKRTSTDTEIIIREDFTYSPQDRLLTHTHQINGGAVQLLANNTYDELGQLIYKKVGNTTAAPIQKVDYTYNIRGWLTAINKMDNLQQDADAKDLFAFKINYNTTQIGAQNVVGLFNGNISETLWKTGSDALERGYGYKYDNLNRLKNAIYEKSAVVANSYNENLSYDKNGNITFLTRRGDSDAGGSDIDNLTYTYPANSNQLDNVLDANPSASGFNDLNKTGSDYSYDANGNMITDKNKNITAITYNQLNLPKKITFGATGFIEYIYNAAGQKLEKIVTEGSNTTNTNYLGGFQYKNNALEFFPTAEGYVKNTSATLSYVFQYKDHLGNVRLSYAKNAGNVLEIVEENNYYPFGLKHKGYNNVIIGAENKYKYNGKEFQDELGLGMYDYLSRNYDPTLGRWINIDPLAEKMRRWSPYTYCFDNPMRFVDPDGMEPVDPPTIRSSSNYSMTYNGKNNYTLTQVNTTNVEFKNEDGSTTINTTTTTTNIKYKMAKDNDGNAVMKVTGGSQQTKATSTNISFSPYQGPVGGGNMVSNTKTIIDYSKPMSSNSASAAIKSDKTLSGVVKGIQNYHSDKGYNHSIFMDPKNTGISPWVPIGVSAGFQSISKFASVGNAANWAGIAAGAIQLGVDEYYAGDSERSIGRTAVINLTAQDGK